MPATIWEYIIVTSYYFALYSNLSVFVTISLELEFLPLIQFIQL